jgi:hypothetical protein
MGRIVCLYLHQRLDLIRDIDLTHASFLGDIDRVAAKDYVPSTGKKRDFLFRLGC